MALPTKAFLSCAASSSGAGTIAGTLSVAIALSTIIALGERMEMAVFIELKLKACVLALLWEKDSKAAKVSVSSNSHFHT